MLAVASPARAGAPDDEPDLPSGLGQPAAPEIDAGDDGPWLPFELRGFAELRGGVRTQDDPDEKRASLGEARLHIEIDKSWQPLSLAARLAVDLIFDPVLDAYEPDLETGDGAVDLREANLVASPSEAVDVKIGRQILTWGTGDLLFINDLFPKDWTAFLVGRDLAYLKAPSDAVKLSGFHRLANVDVAYTPRFDADRFPDRRRLSSWDPATQEIAGRDALIVLERPDRWFRDGEWALRLHRRVGRYELAAYGYYGFWKSPAGADATTGAAVFPALSVYGASARAPMLGGIANIEAGFFDSRDDGDGDDPFVRNSELRALVGFEREAARELTVGLQYYIELMRDHDGYRAGLPPATPVADDVRHVVTARIRWLAWRQTLTMSLFAFMSPSDRDAYLLPSLTYKIDDHWRAQAGANVFLGQDDHTFFGQFRRDTNVYSSVRYAW